MFQKMAVKKGNFFQIFIVCQFLAALCIREGALRASASVDFEAMARTNFTMGGLRDLEQITWSCDWATQQKKGRKTTPYFIEKAGFSSDTHVTQTEDGYDLVIHQILTPSDPKTNEDDPEIRGTKPKEGRCCLFMHGYLTASDSFFFQPHVQNSLPVLMAQQGCQVYLGNFRGNCYSRGHRNMTTDDHQYWKFSYHELGYYDLATSIDFVLGDGNCSQVTFVGHSLGTTAFFVLMTSRPEYNAKVDFAVQLAPTVFLGHATSPLVKTLALAFTRPGRLSNLGAYLLGGSTAEFFPCLPMRSKIFSTVCGSSHQATAICQSVPFGLMGYDFCQFRLKDFKKLIHQLPCPSSVFVNVHYLQQVKKGTFCQYNYGRAGNRVKYGADSPPCYDLSQVTTKVRLYHSCNDWICTCPDVEMLADKLPNASKHKVNFHLWNHMDHVTAIDALPLLYCPVLNWTEFSLPAECDNATDFVAPCHHSP